MVVQHEAPAVAIARAHVEAWTNHDFDTARAGLAPDVRFTLTTTAPNPQTLELTGADNYMKGLTLAAQFAVPESLRIPASTGDDHNALLMQTYDVDFDAGAWKGRWTLSVARLYRIDDNNKIEAEHITYYMTQR